MPTLTLTAPDQAPDRPYAFAMEKPDQSLVFADTRTELVADLIPGYEQGAGDLDAAFDLRHAMLHSLQPMLQTGLVNARLDRDPDYLLTLGEDRVNDLLAEDGAYTGDWQEEVPIIAVRTRYEPLTDRSVPTGNVVMLDPSTETTFLDSLGLAGLVRLHLNEEHLADAESEPEDDTPGG